MNKLNTLALSILLSSPCFAVEGTYFEASSNWENKRVDVTICADGINIKNCQNFVMTGFELEVKSVKRNAFRYAGIKLTNDQSRIPKPCLGYIQDYCIFAVDSINFSKILFTN